MSLSEQFTNLGINPGRTAPRDASSAEDLSNAETEPTKMGSNSYANNGDRSVDVDETCLAYRTLRLLLDQASFLVKALKDFILPIIHAQVPGLAANQMRNTNDNIKRPQLEPAAQQLVDALENFVASLTSTQLAHQDETQTVAVRNIRDNRGFIQPMERNITRSQSIPGYFQSHAIKPPRLRLLKLALEAAKNRVFNKMPIRLLSFNSDGSGIDILDRNTIWDRISPLLEAGFNEDQMNMDIMRRTSPDAEMEAIEDFISLNTGYAILSHCWFYEKPGEVTYSDWNSRNFDINSPGYQKLAKFCEVTAKEYGITLAWMDTICINKDSSAELDESIRSMFKWYRDASICITYLAHTTTPVHIRKDAWFTRGWTLQELLAPRRIKFYGANWQKLGRNFPNDKEDSVVQNEIVAATTITPNELNGHIASTCISRKMQWAANRQVTREEDTAYSLMGIFDVSISIAYGEGAERAFFRLVQQVLNLRRNDVQDIMNWGYGPEFKHIYESWSPHRISSLIPSSPQQYLWRAASSITWLTPSIPLTLTQIGLHLKVLLMPASFTNPTAQSFYPTGNYYGSVTIDESTALEMTTGSQKFHPGQRYNILDSMVDRYTAGDAVYLRRYPVTFGVLNFSTSDESVGLPVSSDGIICFAIGLYFGDSSPTYAAETKTASVIRTTTSITFKLLEWQPTVNALANWHLIPKTDLARHGMQLLDMYL